MKKIFLTLTLLCCTSFLGMSLLEAKPATKPSTKTVKNVIFMIGDGMGLNQAYAAAMVKGEPLVMMSQAEALALQETYSANKKITDSAASGTALACGVKTKNGMIGCAPDSSEVLSITELAAAKGKATGIVVTCHLFHATPAAFYAHDVSRKNYEAISKDLLHFCPDLMIGGGTKFLKNRKDSCQIVDMWQAQGKHVCYDMETLRQNLQQTWQQNRKDASAPVLAFLAEEHMPSMAEGREDYLPEAVSLAIEHLSKDKDGFFLMVEGSAIDFSGHSGDVAGTVAETLDFDKAVQVAIDFAKRNKETLVVVTADHETGGLSLLQNEDYQEEKGLKHRYTTTGHTGVPVMVYLYGKGADLYPATMQNSDHKAILSRLMKL